MAVSRCLDFSGFLSTTPTEWVERPWEESQLLSSSANSRPSLSSRAMSMSTGVVTERSEVGVVGALVLVDSG